MIDYIEAFLNESKPQTKTNYTIEEYLREFTKGGDRIMIFHQRRGQICAMGVIDEFKRIIKTLPLEIRCSELEEWQVKVRSDPKDGAFHFLTLKL